MDGDQKQLINGIQTIVIIVVIPLAIIPLIQKIIGARQGGLFRLLFNEPVGSAQWIIPIALIAAAAVIVIAVEELPKRGG